MNQTVNKTQNRDINDNEANHIRLLWDEFTNSLKKIWWGGYRYINRKF